MGGHRASRATDGGAAAPGEETWLVTGATGFLGAHLAESVVAAGRRVVLAGRDPARRVDRLGPDVPFVELDLAELDSVVGFRARLAAALPGSPSIPVVLHAAAMARGAACAADPGRAFAVNSHHLAVFRTEVGPEVRFVHTSTDLVWGGAACPPGGFVEDGPPSPAPLDVYAASKLQGEELLLASDGPPARTLVARLPLLYGDSRGRGQGATDALVEALAAGRPTTLFTDEWRTPLEVSSAARALVQLAAGGATGLLHLGGPERASRAELGARALEAIGWRGPRPAEGSRADFPGERPADTSLDSSRARALLSFPLPDLDRGLATWARARGLA